MAARVSVVTKSGGTNQLHGNVFELVRNNAFAANNFYSNATSLNLGADGKAQVPALRYNNFPGETLGGPVYIPKIYNGKNKTFFFFSQEFRRATSLTPAAPPPCRIPLNSTVSFPVPVCVAIQRQRLPHLLTSTHDFRNIDPVAKSYIKDIFSKLPLNPVSNHRALALPQRL